MEIIEGIHRVDEASNNMAHSNVYLVVNGNELVVIDTGMSGNAKKIVKYIEEIGHQPSEVTTIVLTHYHMDHAGSVKDLKKLTKAKVAVHMEDAGFVAGKKAPKAKTLLLRAVYSFNKPARVDVDIELKEGDKIANLTVIELPGHTPGSIALLDTQRKALFVGDTLRYYSDTKVTGAPKQFTWDEEKEKEAIKKVAALDFEIMLPGHGEVLMANGTNAVKEYLAALK